MADPISIQGFRPGQPVNIGQGAAPTGASQTSGGQSFKDVLLDSLNEVNQLQQEAADGVEKLVTGETDNMAEVFSAVRKSEVAFGMLMEMRNKLVEAYREVQQMRV